MDSCLVLLAIILCFMCCKKSEKHGMVWDIYGDMIQRRISPNQTTVKIMVSALCKEGGCNGLWMLWAGFMGGDVSLGWL